MSSLISSVESNLPPGFRFHPRDEELICDYLMKWVSRCPNQFPLLIEVDLNKCEPWDIPETARVGSKEWYFYTQKDKKYATGLRTNRATLSGYWKATGKDCPITRKGALVGMRKTLVFYQGRAPKGKKSEWVMHEFRLEGALRPGPKTILKEDWVLCRVFYKNRSDVHQTKQEPMCRYDDNTSSLSPAALPEPYITFDPVHRDCISNQYDEQVPCFSIFTQKQTSPTFSLPQILEFTDLQWINSPNCDKKVLTAVLNQLTKTENCNNIIINSNNYDPGSMIRGTYSSPSFGEGSSDSYLSEVGLSSMWNQY